jgi:hypothetical protein
MAADFARGRVETPSPHPANDEAAGHAWRLSRFDFRHDLFDRLWNQISSS